MRLSNLAEGGIQAITAIGAQKVRSALTILGIVIGVTTVMLMASLIGGLRNQILIY